MVPLVLALHLGSAAQAADDLPLRSDPAIEQRYRVGNTTSWVGAIVAPAGAIMGTAGFVVTLVGVAEGNDRTAATGAGLFLGGTALSVGGTIALLAGTHKANRALSDIGVASRHLSLAGWGLLGLAVTCGTLSLFLPDFNDYLVPLTLGSAVGAYSFGIRAMAANHRDRQKLEWSLWADPRLKRGGLLVTGRF